MILCLVATLRQPWIPQWTRGAHPMPSKRRPVIISEPRSPKHIPPKSDLWDPRKPPGGKPSPRKKSPPEPATLKD